MDELENGNQDERWKDEKRRHGIRVILVASLSAFVVLLVGFLFWNAYQTHTYRGVEVGKATERADGNSVAYRYFNGNILKYSKDGASVLDASGKEYWNGGYEMNNPTVDTCGRYVVIADVGGKDCYVFNGKDSGVKVENDLPILQARVSAQGIVALWLEESESNLLCLLNPYSSTASRLVEIPTNVQTDGYPLDFALSPDAKSLATVYVGVNDGVMESKLVFYNFSEVGKEKNNLVGGKSYPNEVLGKVEFIGDDRVCVFREKGFTIYKNMKQPEEERVRDFEQEIQSVLYEKGMVGFLFEENDGEAGHRLKLFNESGRALLDKRISYDYEQAALQGGEVILYTNQDCRILRKNGKEKLAYAFENAFLYLFKSKRRNRYYVIDEREIREVKLVEG